MQAGPGLLATRPGSRRHFSAIVLLLAAGASLAACAPLAPRAAQAAATQPLAQMVLPAGGTAAQVQAHLLAAEFAMQDADVAQAARDYAEAAALSSDHAIAQRALTTALAARDVALVQRAIDRLQALGAGVGEVAGARAQLALLTGDRDAAVAQFRVELAHGKSLDWKTFAAALLVARDKVLAGNVLEAVATTDRLPADETLWVALSQLGEHLGRHAYARQLADAAATRFGGVEAIRWAASLRVAAKDRAGALALYAKGIAAHPRDVDLRLGYAALLDDAGRHADALRALAQGPQTDRTWAARIGYAARAKDNAALRRMYTELQHAPAAQRQANAFLLGQLAELMDHDAEALRWYGEVAPDDSHAVDALVRRAVLLDKLGQPDQAHALAKQLQDEGVDDVDRARTAYELDAQLYSRHGDHTKAIAAYNRGLVAMPGDAVLTYDRGIEEAAAGDTDAAIADFRSVLADDPDNVEAMNALGFTLADARRDLPEATELLRKALAAKPDAVEVIDSWGWLQYRLGKLDEAATYLKRAWDQQQDPDIGAHLGEVLWKLGQRDHARAVFATVRKLDPHNDALVRAEKALRP